MAFLCPRTVLVATVLAAAAMLPASVASVSNPAHELCLMDCNFVDTTTNGMNAQLQAGATCTAGQGVNFDGVDDHLSVDGVSLGGNLSFAAWVHVDSYTLIWSRLFDFGDGPGDSDVLVSLNAGLGQGNAIRAAANNDNDIIALSDTPDNSAPNGETHIVVTFETTSPMNTVVIYVNGVAQTSVCNDFNNPFFPGCNFPGNVLQVKTRAINYLGRSQYVDDGFWAGIFRHFAVWDRVLTQADVTTLYNGGFQQACINTAEPTAASTTVSLCSTGIMNGDNTVCCAASCGQCGGCGCASFTGGAELCCPGTIANSETHCLVSSDVGCLMGTYVAQPNGAVNCVE